MLCSFAGGAGHLVPQIPLHRALASAGHELSLVGRASGADAAPVGLYTSIVTHSDRRKRLAVAIAPLALVDIEHEVSVIGQHFAGDAALRSAKAVGEQLTGVDMVVCDEVDFGAIAVAQRAQIPVVVVAVIVSGALVQPERLTEELETLRRNLGSPKPVRLRGDFFVIPFHPSMRDPRFPAPAAALWMRPDPGPAPHPEGLTVATLGTEFNTESGDLFNRILAALAIGDAQAVVAVGRDLDPARFGSQPPHVRVEQYVDLDAVVPRADVVLHHGGSGLFVRCVLGGAVQIVFPMGADQPFTAERVRQLGLGRALDPIAATPAEIARTIVALRTDELTHRRVSALRQATVALPEPAAVVRYLEAATFPEPGLL